MFFFQKFRVISHFLLLPYDRGRENLFGTRYSAYIPFVGLIATVKSRYWIGIIRKREKEEKERKKGKKAKENRRQWRGVE